MKKLILIAFVAIVAIGCKKSDDIITPVVNKTWISGKWTRTKRVFTYVQYGIAKKDSTTDTNELNFVDENKVTSSERSNQESQYYLTGAYGPYISFNGSEWVIKQLSTTSLTLSGQIVTIDIRNYTDTYIKAQ